MCVSNMPSICSRSLCLCCLCFFSGPIPFRTQSDDPISCFRKPVERTNKITYPLISLVRSTGIPQKLVGSSDWVRKWIGASMISCDVVRLAWPRVWLNLEPGVITCTIITITRKQSYSVFVSTYNACFIGSPISSKASCPYLFAPKLW